MNSYAAECHIISLPCKVLNTYIHKLESGVKTTNEKLYFQSSMYGTFADGSLKKKKVRQKGISDEESSKYRTINEK